MAELIGKRLGQYEILDIIGRGGMATVYRAHQPSMDRDVAVKVISGELSSNPDFIARFEYEARLIAHLQHAHILPVYDFGREDQILYLAMRLVDGGSLDQRLRQGPLPLTDVGRLFPQIASALTYAHNEGVVHRDLKPNNILLDKSGNPYLTDFGIAKLVQSSVAMTATGTVMGTPSYMSPEQWRGGTLDARADIYALGVMLYEMLTGKLPFIGETPFVLMYKHFDEVPPFVTTVNPGVPQSVDMVIHRAMAKDPADRYSSADEMAEDLAGVLAGQAPITIKRKPSDGSTSQPDTIVLGGDATEIPTQVPTVLADEPHRADVKVPTSRRTLLIALGLIVIVLVAGVVIYLATRPTSFHEIRRLEGHTDAVEAVTWSPDGSKLASGGDDNTIRIWNASSGETLFTLHGHNNTITALAWSPDGKKLASTSDDKTLRVWNPENGEPLATLTGDSSGGPRYLAWSKDSAKLAIGNDNGNVQLWDMSSDPVTLRNEQGWITPVALSPDGTKIANGTAGNAIQLWDLTNRKLLDSFPAHNDLVYFLAWSPDGSRLASASSDGTVRLWDMAGANHLALLTLNAHASGVNKVRWSPDGRYLVTSSGFINLGGVDDPTVRIWDAETGKLLYTLEGHTKPVLDVAWSPDGTRLATVSFDTTVRIWSK